MKLNEERQRRAEEEEKQAKKGGKKKAKGKGKEANAGEEKGAELAGPSEQDGDIHPSRRSRVAHI